MPFDAFECLQTPFGALQCRWRMASCAASAAHASARDLPGMRELLLCRCFAGVNRPPTRPHYPLQAAPGVARLYAAFAFSVRVTCLPVYRKKASPTPQANPPVAMQQAPPWHVAA
eukprot:354519-Chlamydomonas_euryale.AAC.6